MAIIGEAPLCVNKIQLEKLQPRQIDRMLDIRKNRSIPLGGTIPGQRPSEKIVDTVSISSYHYPQKSA
jgi:hypothetical protein